MLPLATTTWDESELRAIHNVIQDGNFTMGEYVKNFEYEFSKWVKSKYVIMTNSGSSANLLAIASLFYKNKNPLKRGDEIIVPAVSWSTTYFPLYQYGLKIKFVDIDSDTLNIDLAQLNDAISKRTRAVMVVNLLGNPVDFKTLRDIIGNDIYLIEDNCEALGARFNDKFTGTFGDVGTFSTYFSHHISTIEGGMVVTDNQELYHILLCLRSHGWTRHLPKENLICEIGNEPFEESFRFILPGYNLRPTEFSGAIGIEQLKKADNFIEGRRRNGKTFQKLFKDLPVTIQKETGESSWFGFSFLLPSGIERKEILDKLTKFGFETRPIVTGNFTQNPVIKYFDYEIHKSLSNSQYVHNKGFFVGNHHYDIEKELIELRNILEDCL